MTKDAANVMRQKNVFKASKQMKFDSDIVRIPNRPFVLNLWLNL